jgi:hypothetical protein
MVQALHLMNSRELQTKMASDEPGAVIQALVKSDRPPEEIVKQLYLRCYSRPPTAEELKIATAAFTGEGATKRSATEDVLWALLNSAEFVFNH